MDYGYGVHKHNFDLDIFQFVENRTLNIFFCSLWKNLKSVKILPAFSTVLARVFLFGTFIVIGMVFTSVSGKFSVSRWGVLWKGTLTEKISEKKRGKLYVRKPKILIT